MRIGFNPNKDKVLNQSNYNHQVIVPVHIPNFEGYFKDSFKILQFCLESLFKTSHAQTYFTIVNNGSCIEIVAYLNELYQENKIQEVIHTDAIGKLNAVLKGLTGHPFELITITDADVLFLNNWQKATYQVFEAFPKAGVVSPAPNPKLLRYYTANAIGSTLFSKNTCFTDVEDKESLIAFAKSIGNEQYFKNIHLSKNLSIASNNVNAIIGAGHFVATYKGICFNNLHQRFSKYSLGGDSEQVILDKPVTDLGMWRLSTSKSYANHLGNVIEPWMETRFLTIEKNLNQSFTCNLPIKSEHKLVNLFWMRFFAKIIFRKPFWQLYLRWKGLKASEAKQY